VQAQVGDAPPVWQGQAGLLQGRLGQALPLQEQAPGAAALLHH
jgi:hypothetical protein